VALLKTLSLTQMLLVTALAWASPAGAEELANCPTTVPSADLLGKPFPSSDRWYGSETLAVILRPDGIWRGMGPERNYRDKLFWWSLGFKPGMESSLEVSARKLGDPSAQADISRSTNAHSPSLGGWTMLVGVELPSAGCWEITGRYLGQTLSFVVEVRSNDSPPNGAT
jgi:hypothetical protein